MAHVVMHMGSSIDGRIVPSDWPKTATAAITEVYERIHRDLKGDAWIVGRVTMAEFGKGEPRPAKANGLIARSTFKAPGAAQGPYAVALDAGAKLHLNRNTANDDPIVVVLTEAAPDDHLAELHRDGISYLFAGTTELDLKAAIDKLEAEFGIKRLLLEGGGGINGSFLAAGLIDEISLLLIPVADGAPGAPTVFDRPETGSSRALTLQSVDQLEGGLLHLRYHVG